MHQDKNSTFSAKAYVHYLIEIENMLQEMAVNYQIPWDQASKTLGELLPLRAWSPRVSSWGYCLACLAVLLALSLNICLTV